MTDHILSRLSELYEAKVESDGAQDQIDARVIEEAYRLILELQRAASQGQ